MSEKRSSEVIRVEDDGRKGSVVSEKAVASAALTAAVEAQKPSLLSRNILKLYFIMVCIHDLKPIVKIWDICSLSVLGRWLSRLDVEWLRYSLTLLKA